jgi:hypothetical protein
MRSPTPALAAAFAALFAATPAQAEPYMWGVGGTIGTIAVPGQYPWGFPPAVGDYGTIQKVQGDFLLGLDGVYYASESTRFALQGRLDLARGFTDANILGKYNYIIPQGDEIDVVTGVGLGFGSQKFKGYAYEELKIPYYPVRGEVGLMYRNGEGALQLLLFAQFDIPANHKYTNWNGFEEDVGTGFYLSIGLEFAVMVGDFSPPKKKTSNPPPKNGGNTGGKPPTKPTKPPTKPTKPPTKPTKP